MQITSIIEKKRDGLQLTTEEIYYFIKGYTNNDIPDYQISALLMAIYLQGMTDEEQAILTQAMVESGDEIDLSLIEGIKVDKHSTGGVGDKVSIVLAPLVASLGVPVAKMSGRGLGHTGGTIDKLESIPGFHVEITNDDFISLVNKNKLAVIGQSGNLTPADKKIYALRDVTGTVDSIPLIASSIMSKKIASGADAIVLDVKTGTGAFMKELPEAKKLAQAMVEIGNNVGKKTMAIISDMSQPLGYAVGNALEIKEAIDTLKGEGPDDLTELCLTLGSQMVTLGKPNISLIEAKEKLRDHLNNGVAFDRFKTFIKDQGGDVEVAKHPELLPQAPFKMDLLAEKSGTVSEIIANDIGTAALHLGAGRFRKDTIINPAVGIVLQKKIGDHVKEGEPLLTIHSSEKNISSIKQSLKESILIDDEKHDSPTLIYDFITS